MVSIKEIMDLIPHRYPFLLVDRVVELDKDAKKIVTVKNVTINEPFFQGHFPGEPIMPGVLIVEAMAQSAGIYHFLVEPDEGAQADVRFIGIDKCRFRRPVVPGDQLRFEVESVSRKKSIYKVRCKALVDGQVAAEADLMVSC